MPIVTCDRAPGALTVQAIEFTGTNIDELRDFVGRQQVLDSFNRSIIIAPGGVVFTWLTAGDWIVKGIGHGWDFYIIKADKMRELWLPREG